MAGLKLYHNPRCSKSRQALELLRERGVEPELVHYLEHPPSTEALQTLLQQLGMTPRALLRRGESEYKELGLADPALSDTQIIEALSRHPRLIERPIAVRGDRATVGRPPENVLALLADD